MLFLLCCVILTYPMSAEWSILEPKFHLYSQNHYIYKNINICKLPQCKLNVNKFIKGFFIPTAMTRYTIRPVDHVKRSFLITYWTITSKCSTSFFGTKTRSILEEKPGNLTSANFIFYQQVMTKYDTDLKSSRFFEGIKIETGGVNLYNCEWMKDKIKTISIFKVESIQALWSLNGSLLKPVLRSSCGSTSRSSICPLSNSSYLIYDPHEIHPCNLRKQIQSNGVIKSFNKTNMDNGKITLGFQFLSYNPHSVSTFSLSEKYFLEPSCELNGNLVFSSEEGELLSFRSIKDIEVLYDLFTDKLNNASFKIAKNDWLMDYYNIHLLPYVSSGFKTNIKRFSNITDLNDIASYYKNGHLKYKRVSSYNYPESDRLNFLENHLSMGLSQILFNFQAGSNALTIQNDHLSYLLCLFKNDLMRTQLLDKQYKNFIITRTHDYALEFHSLRGCLLKCKKYLSVIISLSSLTTLNVSITDDNKIKVEWRFPDQQNLIKTGFLESKTGRVSVKNLIGLKYKSTSKPPNDFLIPTYFHGDWTYHDYLSSFSKFPQKYEIPLNISPSFEFEDIMDYESSSSLIDILDSSYIFNTENPTYTEALKTLWTGFQKPSSVEIDKTNVLLYKFLFPILTPIFSFCSIFIMLKLLFCLC